MEPLDITDDPGEGEQIPDRPHVEIMFEALNDTLAGVECKNLSEAQVYAEGVLMATGALRMNTVEGNEGFFSSIGNGAKAIYDYIVKMFKSVWGFFFNRDAAKEAKEAKAEVKEVQQKIETLRNPTPEAVAECEKVWAYVHARVVADKEKAKAEGAIDLDEFMLGDIKKKLDGTPSEQKAGAKELMDAMPQANKPAQAKFKKAAEGVVTLNKKFDVLMSSIMVRPKDKAPLKPKAGSVGIAVSLVISAATRAYEPSVKQNIDNLIKLENIKDQAHALKVLAGITHDIDAGEHLGSVLKSQTTKLSSEIHQMEMALKAGPLSEEDKDELEVLRVVLAMGSTVAQFLKRVVEAQKHLAKTVGNVFGLK